MQQKELCLPNFLYSLFCIFCLLLHILYVFARTVCFAYTLCFCIFGMQSRICKNIQNMQNMHIYMHKYAQIYHTCKICTICKICKICKICTNISYMQKYAKSYLAAGAHGALLMAHRSWRTNMHKYTKYAKYAKSYRAPLRARHVPRNFACLLFCIAFFAYFVCFCI